MDPKVEEKKVETPPQAPAQGAPGEKKVEEPPKPSGLDGLTREQLQALYKSTPQLFEGIVPEKKEVPPEKKIEEPVKPQSAAPAVYAGKEIKLPEDVPVDRKAVDEYFAYAKEMGLTYEQVQGTVDFQTKKARESITAEAGKPSVEPSSKDVDAANIAALRADKDFGGVNFDANMEISRAAAVKYADPEMLARLKTSDPVLVKHFLKLGKADAPDTTPSAPNRSGNETQDEAKSREDHLKARYKNSPSMFEEPVRG